MPREAREAHRLDFLAPCGHPAIAASRLRSYPSGEGFRRLQLRRAFCSVAKPIMVMPPLSWPLSWMARPFRARNDNCGSCAINHSLDLSLLFSRD